MDVVFVVEGSQKIGTAGFDKVKEFVKKTIDTYSVSPKGSHVAMVEYSDITTTVFGLEEHMTKPTLKSAVDRSTPSGGKTAVTSQALRRATDVLSIASGGRPGAAKVIILVTASSVADEGDLERAVGETKEAMSRIYVVAIDNKDINIGDDVVHVEEPGDTNDVVTYIVEKLDKDIKKGTCMSTGELKQPTNPPTYQPTNQPTNVLTNLPTDQPTNVLTNLPTDQPTDQPTNRPTNRPTNQPTDQPTN